MDLIRGKRCAVLAIAAVMLAACFAVLASPAKAYAAGVDDIRDSMTVIYYPKAKELSNAVIAYGSEVVIDMDSVLSSNSKVASLKKNKNGRITEYLVRTKKTGRATLSFRAKNVGDEEYVDKTIEVTSKKYVNPVKTMKIGKKNYASRFKVRPAYYQGKKISGKVSVKPGKGWKVSSIWFYDYSKKKDKLIKNGRKITLGKGDSLFVWLNRKGTDINEWVQVYR